MMSDITKKILNDLKMTSIKGVVKLDYTNKYLYIHFGDKEVHIQTKKSLLYRVGGNLSEKQDRLGNYYSQIILNYIFSIVLLPYD